ncbi:uncharacterized protein LOC119573956 [Penaeus monodon]|uniref:uncharacterized protein LOC119573956 n=1 Tax=Penaeus monodon TaxID=6687 RepID=UPI0018A757EC|nr:uncharacterized protein LOC119573956 [Penaeus monodon]
MSGCLLDRRKLQKNSSLSLMKFYEDYHLSAYIDDLLIASMDAAEHEDHLMQVSKRLNDYGIQIKVEKPCKRGQLLLSGLEADIAYDAAKEALSAVTSFPSQDAPTSITTDLSNTGTGAHLVEESSSTYSPTTATLYYLQLQQVYLHSSTTSSY